MLTDATITDWRATTGAADTYGQPVRVPHDGAWRCLAEAGARRLQVSGRDVVSTVRVRLAAARDPGIDVGDLVAVGGRDYEVLARAATGHPTLGSVLLDLGPA